MKGSKKHDRKGKDQKEQVEPKGETPGSEELKPEELKVQQENAQKVEDYQDRYLRALAELDNYRKRASKDRAQAVDFAQMQIVRGMLPIMDNLERALAQMKGEVDAKAIQDGLHLIDKQIQSFLESLGLKPIECIGKTFDPHLHEAVLHVPSSDHPDHTVLEEVQKGYRLHDRVLRHALVKVVDNPVAPEKEQASEKKDNE